MTYMTEWRQSFSKMSETVIKDEKKLLSALGFCVRARKLVIGVPMICDALRGGGKNSPKIVFEASDTSDNTHKKISDKCEYYKVRLVRLNADGETLATAIGKSSFLAAVAVTDTQLSNLTEQYIQ